MGFLGFSLHGPHGLIYYWYINPWYLKQLGRFFPSFMTKGMVEVKRVLISVFIDVFCYGLLYGPFMLTYCGLIRSYGDLGKAFSDMKNQFWTTYTASMKFTTFKQMLLYAVFPYYIRGVASIGFRVIWMVILSFIVHNY